VITMLSAPLLLVAVRRHVAARAATGHANTASVASSPRARRGPLTVLVHPLMAAIVFNIVVAASHVPSVVDTLMPTPWGAFATDLAWFLGGVIFWWPVVVPVPGFAHFGPPMKILYLLVGTLFHTVIGMIMLTAEHPLFGIYELAPPVFAIDPRADQQLAGGIMELGVFFAIVAGAGILFFRWAAADDQRH
jgi:putative membrane protein